MLCTFHAAPELAEGTGRKLCGRARGQDAVPQRHADMLSQHIRQLLLDGGESKYSMLVCGLSPGQDHHREDRQLGLLSSWQARHHGYVRGGVGRVLGLRFTRSPRRHLAGVWLRVVGSKDGEKEQVAHFLWWAAAPIFPAHQRARYEQNTCTLDLIESTVYWG